MFDPAIERTRGEQGRGALTTAAGTCRRAWLTDAARLFGQAPDALAAELVESMLRSGCVVVREGRIHAAAEHVLLMPGSLDVPFPRAWPPAQG